MPMEGGQDSLSNVNNPCEPDMKDDDKLEIEERKSPEFVESKLIETVSLDDKPAVPESGEEAAIENQVVAEESEFMEEPEPPVEQAVAEEGDTETIVAQCVAQPVVPESGREAVIENRVVAKESEIMEEPEPPVEQAVSEEGDTETILAESVAQTFEMKAEVEVKQVDEVMVPSVVVANTGDESLTADSKMDGRGDELPVEPQQEMETEEGFIPVVNAKVDEGVVCDVGIAQQSSESEMDGRGDELPVETQREMKTEEELSPVVNAIMDEGVVSDVGIAQQSSELGMEGRADELSHVREGTLELESDYRAEREIGDTVMVEEVGGEYNELVKNNTENDVDGDENGEDEANVVANASEVGNAEKPAGVEDEKVDPVVTVEMPIIEVGNVEKPAGIEGEKVDPVTTGEMPITEVNTEVEMITEVNENVVDVTEKDPELSGVGTDVVADETLIPGAVMIEDGNMSMETLEDLKMDEPVNVVANKEEVVKEELLEGDIKTEKEIGVELEMINSNVVEEIELAEADMGTEAGTDKFVDEDNKIETEETSSDGDEDALEDDEDEQMVAEEEEIGTQDTEMETETDVAESEKTSGGKSKRGKLSKSPPISKAKASSRKTVGEDVCFICFDGGELVLCDRRGCPKAYHPSCVNRDEAFFKSKGRWNCGWHLCSICEKNARYMCYTCTFSLCKSCTKDAVISCVRGNKGFCETCMRTVLLIENNENNNTQVDFDDKSSWEFLFKDYYIELKSKLSLSSVEIAEAKNPWKGSDRLGPTKQESSEAHADANDGGSASDNDFEDIKTTRSKRRKVGKQSKPTKRKGFVSTGIAAGSLSENSEWASKELLEFVSHMKDGDTSVLNQYDVQQLLLEYIKRNKLRDPRRQSQIICDARLKNLFGKPRCGHFEMLKLLESHYFIRDEQNDDVQGSVVNTENNQLDIDGNPETPTKGVKDKRKRNTRKKVDPRYNLDDFAAIDMHNISLIYLRRKLMEDLLEEADRFHDKVVGTFVRIRISGSTQKQDLYRLVQVVGTSKAAEPYKVGKKTTDIMVEILNLDKTEIIQIDTISNQEFTEEECKRLRQSIKCGLISRLTVGEILDKATEIQTVRVNDWIESEILRLTHLRDRASDMGLRKGLRESVEKLDLLKTPEERRRRLEEIPEILSDPKMDPSYESDEKESESEESRRDAFMRSRGYGFIRRGKGPISPVTDNSVNKDSWSGSGKVPNRIRDMTVNEDSRMSEKEIDSKISERYSRPSNEYDEWSPRTASRSESFSGVATVTPQASLSTGVSEISVKINESEKMWHYKDPSGKQQGPFSVVQLRKWNNTGYFPADLRIWKATEKQENSILLADALAGKFPEQSPVQSMFPATNTLHSPHGKTSLHQDRENSIVNPNPGYASKLSTEKWAGNELTNLPSPTPRQSNAGWAGGEGGLSTAAKNQAPVVSGLLSSPNAVIPNIGTHSSASGLNSVIQTGTGFSPVPNTQQGVLTGAADSPYTQSTMMSQQPQSAQMQAHAPTGVQPVHNVISQNLPSGQPQGYNWNTSNVQNPSGTLTANVQPDVWHPSQGSQPNMQPNVPWSMGPAAENNTSMGVGAENPNSGWGTMQANPNMGWGNMAPQNMNWGTTMQAPPPGNTNSGWIPPAGNIQGMVAGNMNSGWVPPSVQGPLTGNGWVPPSGNAVGPSGPPIQGGPPQGNANQGWGPPQGNQVSWGGEQSPVGGQFSGQSGGGGRPWNRQPSFGGGGSRKRDVVCPYNAKGRCRKGNRCDYMHI